MDTKLPQHVWDCHTHIFGPWSTFPLPANAAYRPAEAPFEALQALHARIGVDHGVLVQAAAYGTDHRAMLAALAAGKGRYFGVALIDDATSDAQLRALHEGGVRGIRFNLMGHLPGLRDPSKLVQLARRVQPLGWHVLLHGAIADLLPSMDALGDVGLPLVIDHMARPDIAKLPSEADLQALERHLSQAHCWIKLSGVDRMMGGAPPPWDAAIAFVKHLLQKAPTRAMWGSDWPHPNIVGDAPDEAKLLDFIRAVCGDEATARAVLCDNPSRLYS